MNLKRTPELHAFLSTYFPDSDPDADEQATQAFITSTSPERQQLVLAQAKSLLADQGLSTSSLPSLCAELGTEANRWFANPEEAQAWLRQILGFLTQGLTSHLGGAKNAVENTPKDSNGALLAEGDSVQVIKDLKVKGGTSDLKRGTLIKKIHLIDDTQAVECRVDGSTLVLKTCFLKKA